MTSAIFHQLWLWARDTADAKRVSREHTKVFVDGGEVVPASVMVEGGFRQRTESVWKIGPKHFTITHRYNTNNHSQLYGVQYLIVLE